MSSIHPDMEHKYVTGHLCSKEEHYVTCSVSFFGSKTLTNGINRLDTKSYGCIYSINEWKDGRLNQDPLVKEDCVWMKNNTETKILFNIKEKSVFIDNYNQRFVDQIFLSGYCETFCCQTKYSRVLWLIFENIHDSCPQIIPSDLTVDYGISPTLQTVTLYNNYIPGVNLDKACRSFVFCGYKGFVLKTNHFLSHMMTYLLLYLNC